MAARKEAGGVPAGALFSGSTLEDLRVGGAALDVTGSMHSNLDLRLNGAEITVSGALEAAQALVNNGRHDHGGGNQDLR